MKLIKICTGLTYKNGSEWLRILQARQSGQLDPQKNQIIN